MADPKQISILKLGSEKWNVWRKEQEVPGFTTFEADLEQVGSNVLAGAILRGVDLRRANLSGSDLSALNFAQADLRGADLTGASLQKICLKLASREPVYTTRIFSGQNLPAPTSPMRI